MSSRKLTMIWLVIVALFTAIGLIKSQDQNIRSAGDPFFTRDAVEIIVTFGATGIGIASCITGGLIIIWKLRLQPGAKGRAIMLLLASFVLGLLLPALVLGIAFSGFHLFQGEDGWACIGALLCVFWVDILTLIIFSIGVFAVKRG